MFKRTILVFLAVLVAVPAASLASARSVAEKDVNLDITRRVAAHLRDAGVSVALTRTSDLTRTPSQRVDAASHSEIFVSIHNNSSPNPAADHSEVYEQLRGGPSDVLATSIAGSFGTVFGEPSRVRSRRGDHGDYYFQLRLNRIPAVIVESAFLSNHRQARLLATSAEFREQIASAIAHGILDYQKALGAPLPDAASQERVVLPATVLPTPGSPAGAALDRFSVRLRWAASALPAGYRIYRDGVLLGEIANPIAGDVDALRDGRTAPMSFRDRWAAPGQRYRYEIVAARSLAPAAFESQPVAVTVRTASIRVCLDAGHGGDEPGAIGGY